MLFEQLRDLVVGVLDERAHLLVDDPLGLLGGLADARQEHPLALFGEHRDRADRFAHAPAADHLARDHRQLLDVGLGAGGDLPVDDLLGYAAAQRDPDLRQQLFKRVGHAVGVGRRQRHSQGHPARDDRDLAHRVGARREHPHERVAGLVIGGALAILGFQQQIHGGRRA